MRHPTAEDLLLHPSHPEWVMRMRWTVKLINTASTEQPRTVRGPLVEWTRAMNSSAGLQSESVERAAHAEVHLTDNRINSVQYTGCQYLVMYVCAIDDSRRDYTHCRRFASIKQYRLPDNQAAALSVSIEARKTEEHIDVFERFAKAQVSSAESLGSNTQVADGRWLEIFDVLFSSAATFVLSIALAVEREAQLPGETLSREQIPEPCGDEQLAIDWDKFDHLTSALPAPGR